MRQACRGYRESLHYMYNALSPITLLLLCGLGQSEKDAECSWEDPLGPNRIRAETCPPKPHLSNLKFIISAHIYLLFLIIDPSWLQNTP